MPVRRSFHRQLDDLPEVPFPDWELYSKIESLFREYTSGQRFKIQGTDRRGDFSADDLVSFREELEAREDKLTALSIEAWASESDESDESSRRFLVLVVPGQLTFARVSSGDEVVASGVTERLRDLFSAAHLRLRGTHEQSKGSLLTIEVLDRRGRGAPRGRQSEAALANALRHPIISGLIVGFVLLVLGLWLGLK